MPAPFWILVTGTMINRTGHFVVPFMAIYLSQLGSTSGLQVTRGAGLDETSYGFLMALNGLMIVTLEPALTSWTRRHEPTRVMAAGYLLVGAGMGINAFGALPAVLIRWARVREPGVASPPV